MIITHKHLKQYRYCNRGSRKMAERYGIDWTDFVKNGIDEQLLLETGDSMIIEWVNYIKQQEGKNG